jgi:predicted DsbA family dithiol-disulfide isomerase
VTTRVIRAAVKEMGWDRSVMDEAFADGESKQAVLRDHRIAVERVGAFGVPTIVLSSGRGIFGPVVEDEAIDDPLELWAHVRWLIEKAGFYELKRERS